MIEVMFGLFAFIVILNVFIGVVFSQNIVNNELQDEIAELKLKNKTDEISYQQKLEEMQQECQRELDASYAEWYEMLMQERTRKLND